MRETTGDLREDATARPPESPPLRAGQAAARPPEDDACAALGDRLAALRARAVGDPESALERLTALEEELFERRAVSGFRAASALAALESWEQTSRELGLAEASGACRALVHAFWMAEIERSTQANQQFLAGSRPSPTDTQRLFEQAVPLQKADAAAPATATRPAVSAGETLRGEEPPNAAGIARLPSASADRAAGDADGDKKLAPTASACFERWLQTTALEIEARVRGRLSDEELRPLATLRHELRSALVERVAAARPSESLRHHWASELLDRADLLLTSIDELPAELAAEQLELAADDLRWHATEIERAGSWRRRLRRKQRRLEAEAQERRLQHRLESIFGARAVARFERLILVLIVLVVAILGVQLCFALPPHVDLWLEVVDVAACMVFLTEFGVKWYLAPARARWFWRHFLIDLIPSIPFGLIDEVRLGRLLRLPRLGRYVRLFRPAVRVLRAVGFLIRGIDRLARRYGWLLNRSVILYPTRSERRRAQHEARRPDRRLAKLQAEVQGVWKELLRVFPPERRPEVALARLGPLEKACRRPALAPSDPAASLALDMPFGMARGVARELPAEAIIRRLGSLSAAEVAAELGSELTARLARVIRMFSRPPLCWLPLVRGVVPALAPRMSDAEVAAAGARRLAVALNRYHDLWFWLADLHGTVTPSEFVDRVGTMLVKSSFRPAYRLAVFGGVYLLVIAGLSLTEVELLKELELVLKRFVGSTLLLLGGLCCLVFGLGWWLKRLAREATEFYEQAAQAQFLSLTEMIRSRNLPRDAQILHQRVLRPEWRLEQAAPRASDQEQVECFAERVRLALIGTAASDRVRPFELLERTVLLYRDWLDGAMFVDSDNRTTCQLLGNPAVRQFLAMSRRVGRKEQRRLRALDLERQKSLLGGPYLWFNFISRATAHSVASLIVDYNRHAVPLAELPLVSVRERQRYQAWLGSEPEGGAKGSDGGEQATATDETTYVTTAFTALHFLDFEPHRDREVEERFGPVVIERLRRDRSLLVRRIFGTYPWQLLPKEQRVLNLYALYEQRLAGGRALVLPAYVAGWAVRGVMGLVGWIGRAVREIRRPDLRVDRTGEVEADFATAVRKIDRMRGPAVYASMRLRAVLDPEFLGVPLPGCTATSLGGGDVWADLKFLDAAPWVVAWFEEERGRAEADMRRLSALIEGGLFERLAERLGLPPGALAAPEHLRAAAAAYLADYRGVRRYLSAVEILEEVFEGPALNSPLPAGHAPRPLLKRMFRRYWDTRPRLCVGLAEPASADPQTRAACWRAVRHNLWGAGDALRAWHEQGDGARAEGERRLAAVLRHVGRVTEQLVTMRSIQTLAVLDVLNYRQHVFRLGEYDPDEPAELLEW